MLAAAWSLLACERVETRSGAGAPDGKASDGDAVGRPCDSVVGPGDAAAPCEDDPFGPGLADLPAAALAPGTYDLVLCPGRDDVFALDVSRGVSVRLTFRVSGIGVATLSVTRSGAVVSEWGATAAGTVEVEGIVGDERVVIASKGEAAVRYTLTVEVLSAGCAETAGDSPACLRGIRVLERRALAAGESISQCVSVVAGGQILLLAECGAEAPLAIGRVEGRGSLCRSLGPFGTARDDCGFSLLALGDTPVQIELPPAEDGRAPGVGFRWTGTVESLPVDGLDPPASPALHAELRLLRADGEVTDSSTMKGALASFDLRAFGSGRDSAELTLAAIGRADTGDVVIVSPGSPGASPWSLSLASGEGDVFMPSPLLVDVRVTPEWAAAHIVAVALAGVDRLAGALGGLEGGGLEGGAARAPIHYRWGPERAAPCGTCFSPGAWPAIDLSGRPGDPDAWDDAIILHELGHWVAASFGRDDSPGGAHDGSRVAGALAWSEGFADFHAAWQLTDPVLVDRRAAGPLRRDLEAMSEVDPLARGTSDGTATGLVSERLVAGFLWDLNDESPDEAGEAVAIPAESLFGAALTVARRLETDRGSGGFDVVDFVDCLACVDVEAARAAADLLRARGVPYEPSDTPRCPQL